MINKTKLLLTDIHKYKFLNLFVIFFLIYFIYSYFLKLNFIIDDRDELAYLADSLNLLEGIRPLMSHSPTGLTTWIGSFVVLFDFIFNNLSFNSLETLFENFDLTLLKHYQNLSYIKISLLLLNTILLIYLFFIDKKKIIFLSFFVLYLLPASYEIAFAAKPYFTASIFFIISLVLKDKNKLLALIFYALAISERIEFLLLINVICLENYKIYFKNYLIVFVTFLAVSPWFSLALLQNIKVLATVFYHMSNNAHGSNILINITKISLVGFIIVNFTYSFLKNSKIKKVYLLLLILIILQLYIFQKMQLRWIMPGLILLVSELHFYFLKKENLSKIGLTLIAFLLLTNFNMKKFTSDDEILKIEKSSSYKNIIGDSLLKEELNFKNYDQLFGSYIDKNNIKNINFFNKENAPLSFGQSGNLEKLSHRRYEFLSKYSSGNLSNKYIRGMSGLYNNEKEWCEILNKKDTAIISNSDHKIISCTNINY